MAAFFTWGLQGLTTLETFFCLYIFSTHLHIIIYVPYIIYIAYRLLSLAFKSWLSTLNNILHSFLTSPAPSITFACAIIASVLWLVYINNLLKCMFVRSCTLFVLNCIFFSLENLGKQYIFLTLQC